MFTTLFKKVTKLETINTLSRNAVGEKYAIFACSLGVRVFWQKWYDPKELELI